MRALAGRRGTTRRSCAPATAASRGKRSIPIRRWPRRCSTCGSATTGAASRSAVSACSSPPKTGATAGRAAMAAPGTRPRRCCAAPPATRRTTNSAMTSISTASRRRPPAIPTPRGGCGSPARRGRSTAPTTAARAGGRWTRPMPVRGSRRWRSTRTPCSRRGCGAACSVPTTAARAGAAWRPEPRRR